MGLTRANMFKRPEIVFTTSWDDGWEDDIKVAKILKKYNIPGTFYIVIDWIEKEGCLTWNQVKEIDEMGFNIGSHTVTHPKSMIGLHEETLHYEVQNSKDMLETVLGHNISSFSYPTSKTDDRIERAVINAGYVNIKGIDTLGVVRISILDLAKETIDKMIKNGGNYEIYGHSKDLTKIWSRLDEILRYANEKLNRR